MSTNRNSLPMFENLAIRSSRVDDGPEIAHPPPSPETRDASLETNTLLAQGSMGNLKLQKDDPASRKAQKAARHQEYLAGVRGLKYLKAARHQEQLDRAQARRERRAIVERAKEVADPVLVGRCRHARHRFAVRKGKERRRQKAKKGQASHTAAAEAALASEQEVVPYLMAAAAERVVAEKEVEEVMEGVESLEIDEA